MAADRLNDSLIARLANAGAAPDKIARILGASVDEVTARLEKLGLLHASETDGGSGVEPAVSTIQTGATGTGDRDLQSEFDEIVAGTDLDDTALYVEGSRVVYVVESAIPTKNGLEPVRCSGELVDARRELFDEAIKDIRDNNGLRLRQGPMALTVNCVKLDLASREPEVDRQMVASIGFQLKWFDEKATVALSDGERAAATALIAGIRDDDPKATRFMYAAPVTVPETVDWSNGEYVEANSLD